MKKNKKIRIEEKQTKIYNRKLTKKYPWLIPRTWDGKVPKDYDYSYIEWGCARGWDAAYGDMYLEELGRAVEESGMRDTFQIMEIKEKYGQHRVYCAPTNKKIERIVDKYEVISGNVCMLCGKPDVPMIDTGWISPYCFDCFKQITRRHEDFHIKAHPDYKRSTNDELMERYNNSICDSDPMIPDNYTIKHFGYAPDEVVDISDTVVKIRARWERRLKRRKPRKPDCGVV